MSSANVGVVVLPGENVTGIATDNKKIMLGNGLRYFNQTLTILKMRLFLKSI